jgi:hypothetical protein
MPVNAPDASAFTRLKKLSSAQAQTPQNTVKPLSHLYQPIIPTAGVREFLWTTATNKTIATFTRQLPTTKVMTNRVVYIAPKYTR